jgi:Ca2+/Na+ antiporter
VISAQALQGRRPVAGGGLSGPLQPALLLAAGALGFCALLTLNSGGYHYGVSDQAFYIPVVLDQMDPALFPHDDELIAAQDRFLFFDDWFAPLVRLTGLSLPVAFLAAHVLTLLLLYAAIIGIGRAVYRTWWAVGGLLFLMTARHQIPYTSANSVEGYFHPRMLAFAMGLSATALYLSGRTRWALVVVGLTVLVHPTIGCWFAVLVGGAMILGGGIAPRTVLAGAVVAVVGVVLTLGDSLRDQLVVMDATWLRVLATKGYLVTSDWPLVAWLTNLAITAFVFALYRYRRSLGQTSEREGALVAGCGLLLAVFVVSAPFSYAGVALAVQLQVNRVFWLIDAVGMVLLAGVLFEGPRGLRPTVPPAPVVPRRALVALAIALALTRGGYRGFVERPERPIVQVGLADSDWTELMRWAATQPVGTHFLADPVHAPRYGVSVRAASGRDVYLELIKDSALAIYSSDIAGRVARRIDDIGDFEALTVEHARGLAGQYAIDFLITEQRLDLPVATSAGPLVVYELAGPDPVVVRRPR